MAGTVVADRIEAASTSQLVIENGVALTPPTIADVNGVAIGTFCRAWVNFNGTGTVAIRASFNVSSITDNGVGDYTVNFTNAMPDASYGTFGTSGPTGVFGSIISEQMTTGTGRTTTGIRIGVASNLSAALVDDAFNNVAIFR